MSRPRTVDLLVVGLGAMGSATVDAAASAGSSVIGLEAFEQGHTRGSSHGPTRILRRSIEEGPQYVPLVLDAIERWHRLNAELDAPVFVANGALRLAPSGSPLHAAFIASALAHGLNFDLLSASETRRLYPALAAPDGFEAIVEHEAGVLFAVRAVRALQDRATRAGAELRFAERLERWSTDGDGVVVHTARGEYRASRLVITAGAWTTQVVAELGLPLRVERVVNVTFQPVHPEFVGADRLPAFLVHDGTDGVYGVPAIGGHGVKVGSSGTPTDPDRVQRDIAPSEVQHLRSFVERFLPAAAGEVSEQLTCLYTQAPDGHFVIDRHPEHPQVVIASPCSGHGFKYTTAIGPLLADLALTGTTRIPIDDFSLARLAAVPTGTP